MTTVTLLKHVFTFRKILSEAASDTVRSWDGAAIENAMHWAEYCEKVSQESRGKPIEDYLSGQMRRMVLLENPPSLKHLSLDDLGRARSVLQETLLVNPKCSAAVIEYIWSKTTSDDIESLSKIEGNLRLSEEILQSLSECQPCSDLRSSEDVEILAEVQCDLMKEALETHTELCRSPEEISAYIKSVAGVMSSERQSLAVLAGCLASLSNRTDAATAHCPGLVLVGVLLGWLEEFATQNFTKLLEVHPSELVRVARSCPQFCDIYIQALERASSVLQAEAVQCEVPRMNVIPSLWPWRSRPEFQAVVQHFQALCQSCETLLSQNARQLLRDRCAAQPSSFNVWSDIAKRICT